MRSYQVAGWLVSLAIGSSLGPFSCPFLADGCLLQAAEPASADSSEADTSAAGNATELEQVNRWIRQLDSDQYLVRQTATERLIGAGYAAVEPVAEALAGSSLEVTTRGVHILRELALSGDAATEDAARGALERVAEARVTAAARRAQTTLEMLDEVRQQRAIESLESLGARMSSEQSLNGLRVVQAIMSIQIGEAWQGTVEDLGRLKWLKDVESVTFEGPQVTNAWLAPLGQMPAVESVTLKHTKVDELSLLKPLVNLRELVVMFSPVGDGVVQSLGEHRRVRLVKLYGTGVTPEGAEKLSRQLAGAEVDFRRGAFLGVGCVAHPLGCAVSVIQSGSAAQQAGMLPGDVVVRYKGQKVPDFETLTALISEDAPGEQVTLHVVRNPRIFSNRSQPQPDEPLGISGEPHPIGITVTEVAEKSLAARVGLREGDLLFRFNGQEVTELAQVEKLYANQQAGDATSVELLREAVVMEKTVKLGGWE